MSGVRFLAAAIAALLLAGCAPSGFVTNITGSGHAVTKEFDLTGFTQVTAANAFEVEIAQGDTYSVVVTVDDNLVDRLDVRVSGDTLHVALKPNLSIRNTIQKAKITLPRLTGLNLSGATRTTITGLSSERALVAEVSGASTLGGDLTSGDTRFNVSGASKVTLEGLAQDLRVKVSGASNVNFEHFNSQNTVVDASGASTVTVNASGQLDAEASGASSVRYVGEPAKLIVDTSGASSVKQK